MNHARHIVAIMCLFTLGFATSVFADDVPADKLTPAVGSRGMVSSAHPVATQAGLDILADGGNAFDAAIAVAATLNVTEPQNSGMGGYGLILIYDAAKDEYRVLNCSGRIPQATNSDAFRSSDPDYLANRKGAKAVSTPTNLNAWDEIAKAYGSMEWSSLFGPAIRAAGEGHAVSASTAHAIAGGFEHFPDHAKVIFGDGGDPLGEGDILVQKDLANTLGLVAAQGPKALYGGELGESIIATMEKGGGFLAMADLLANEAEWWDPISIDYRGYQVITCSAPANSFSSLIRMGMMERFDLAALGHNTPDYLHLFAEVTKHAFWCRLKYAGDPDIAPPPLETLLSDAYFDAQAAALNLKQAQDFVPPGVTASAGANTTHFVVADAAGNVVSATQTLGQGFGSRIMVEGRGLWLNNSLYFCTFEPKGNPMDAHPGRRKLISNHPTIVVRDGKPWIAIGTPGGHTIGQTVPQMVMNMLDFDMDVQDAISAPRVSFVEPNKLNVEETLAESTRSALEAKGHTIGTTRAIGNAHGLTIEYDHDGTTTRFTGGSDPRGSGLAKGI